MRGIWPGLVLALLLLPLPLLAAGPTSIEQCIERQRPLLKEEHWDSRSLSSLQLICHDILSGEQQVREQDATNRIYENQIFHGHVLLFTVVFITLSGIVLAALQLWASFKLALRDGGALADGGEVSLQPGNVAVKSSVVGVVILGISLAFFAIFVTQVYTLRSLGNPQAAPAEPAGVAPVVGPSAAPLDAATPNGAAPAEEPVVGPPATPQ